MKGIRENTSYVVCNTVTNQCYYLIFYKSWSQVTLIRRDWKSFLPTILRLATKLGLPHYKRKTRKFTQSLNYLVNILLVYVFLQTFMYLSYFSGIFFYFYVNWNTTIRLKIVTTSSVEWNWHLIRVFYVPICFYIRDIMY